MSNVAKFGVGVVAALHVLFLVMEAFLWTTPRVRKRMQLDRIDPKFAEMSKPLAANMGLYNGFLAAGLFWSIWPVWAPAGAAVPIAVFFLLCVAVAGIVGAVTVNPRILYAQTVPAAIALALIRWT